jgi:hypothetical protein
LNILFIGEETIDKNSAMNVETEKEYQNLIQVPEDVPRIVMT